MNESHIQLTSEQIITQLQQTLSPLERDIRDVMGESDGALECISWTNIASEMVDDTLLSFPPGTKIFNCTNSSVSDRHHWLEIEVPVKNKLLTLIWDDTKQKLKEKSLAQKNSAKWSGYHDSQIERVQVFPEFEE